MNLNGTFEDVFINKERLETKNYYNSDPYHAYYNGLNCALAHINNSRTTSNPNKKILIIQDSFGWCMTPFLSLDIAAIDTIYPEKFTGSIETYIEETKPDMVIMLYSPTSIASHIMFDLK